jgi:DNA repair protein RadC
VIERIETNAGAPAVKVPPHGWGGDPDHACARELIAVLLGGKHADAAAARIAGASDTALIARWSARRFEVEFGIARAGALRLAAAFALGRCVERATRAARPSLRTPALVHEVLAPELRGLERETFHALLLDGKHRLQGVRRISEGTLTSSLVHPREVFAPALREGAAALIVAHNHPSGDPEPSAEDVSVTRRLIEVGRLVGVPLVDHVVIGDGRWVSLRERIPFDG